MLIPSATLTSKLTSDPTPHPTSTLTSSCLGRLSSRHRFQPRSPRLIRLRIRLLSQRWLQHGFQQHRYQLMSQHKCQRRYVIFLLLVQVVQIHYKKQILLHNYLDFFISSSTSPRLASDFPRFSENLQHIYVPIVIYKI